MDTFYNNVFDRSCLIALINTSFIQVLFGITLANFGLFRIFMVFSCSRVPMIFACRQYMKTPILVIKHALKKWI